MHLEVSSPCETNEDMERETEDKTSAVHFTRFELTPKMKEAAKAGAQISVGCDLQAYQQELVPVPENIRTELVRDLENT